MTLLNIQNLRQINPMHRTADHSALRCMGFVIGTLHPLPTQLPIAQEAQSVVGTLVYVKNRS